MALEDNKEALFLAGALGVSAAMLYKGSQIRKKGEESKISVIQAGGKLIAVKPIKIDLPEEALKKASDAQKLSIGTKSKSGKSFGRLNKPTIPIKLSDKIALSDMRSNGLLGRLVAQYYAFERARLFYMTRCGAYTFCDDTPTWLQRNNQLVHESDIQKKIKSSKWFGVGLRNADYLDRWDGGTSKSKLWRRRYSLEATFSNWSGPGFTGSPKHASQMSIFTGDDPDTCKPYQHKLSLDYFPIPKIKQYYPDYGSGNKQLTCGPNDFRGQADCIKGKFWHYEINPMGKFYYGDYPFGLAMLDAAQSVITHGYKYPTKDVSKGDYTEVCAKDTFIYNRIPWRNFKGVSVADRLKATYTLPVEHDYKKRWERNHRIGRYYRFGYLLVRTVLDILCAEGKAAEDYPEFAEHCTWWCIPQPNKEFLARYPDLSVIGSGVIGLSDITIPELIKYVMEITPKPGTVVPWEDKGPLYTWPESTGYLQPLPVNLPLKPRQSDDLWGTIVQYLLSFETSICSSVASGVANTVINEAIKWAEDVCSDWINEGISQIMDNLNNEFTKAALSEVKEIIKDVSGFAANMSRFVDVEKELIGILDQGSNLSKVLTDYLDLVATDPLSDRVSGLKNDAMALTDSLRKQWDWADELIGSTASMGKDVKRTLNNVIAK